MRSGGEGKEEEDRDDVIDIISLSGPKRTRGEGNFIIIIISNVPNAREYYCGVSHLSDRRRSFFSPISRTVDTNDLHAALPRRN